MCSLSAILFDSEDQAVMSSLRECGGGLDRCYDWLCTDSDGMDWHVLADTGIVSAMIVGVRSVGLKRIMKNKNRIGKRRKNKQNN